MGGVGDGGGDGGGGDGGGGGEVVEGVFAEDGFFPVVDAGALGEMVEVMGEEVVEEGEEGGEAFGGEMVLARAEGEGADAGDDFVVAVEAGVGGLGVLGIGGDAWVEDVGADRAPDGFVVGVHFVEVGIFGGARGFGAAFGDGVVGLVFGGAKNSREIFASVFGIEVEVSDPTSGFGGGFGGQPVWGGEVFGDDDEGVVWAEGFTIAPPVADALGREGAIVEEVDGELLATIGRPEEATEGGFVLFGWMRRRPSEARQQRGNPPPVSVKGSIWGIIWSWSRKARTRRKKSQYS